MRRKRTTKKRKTKKRKTKKLVESARGWRGPWKIERKAICRRYVRNSF